MGKSRITRALIDEAAPQQHTRIRYQCSPYHTDSALWPVIQQLFFASGIAAADANEVKLDKVEALLKRGRDDISDAAPLITDLLDLDGQARYGKLDLTPQARRIRTLKALADQLTDLATKQPVLMVVEDAHWIDPTMHELIEQCLDYIDKAQVLILLTSRPDNQPDLTAHPYVTRLTLGRLARAGVEAIVSRLRGNRELPATVIDAITSRSDGIPLFVEELTKTILETGKTTIPATLHDSLMARLDRFATVKEVAQIGAVIGRAFSHALLAAVIEYDEGRLRNALDQLIASELIFRRGLAPDAIYTFKHALVQDAAYESLLRSKRQELHGRIARRLEERFPEIVASEPEMLGHHHGAAGNMEMAFQYSFEAGQRAAKRSANEEAIQHLVRARGALATLPDSSERVRR